MYLIIKIFRLIISIFSLPTLRMGILLLIIYCSLFTDASAQQSPDAIAFRVISNPQHYSPARWYSENIKIKGSPSEALVDGYQAVRDGRTVYVGAANYSAGKIYTNLYIISYNQAAESATVDIFGQLLSHWRFNTNLEISGNCRATSTLACINDRECPDTDFCSSLKGEVVRNTRRLADLADIEMALANYKQKNGKFPTLTSGSYLPHKTISVWPSWQETLAKALGSTLPVDPVNRLGACTGYNPGTCWDEANSAFAGTLPDDINIAAGLPADSEAYVYRATADGLAYTLSLSTVNPATLIDGSELTDKIANQPPVIEAPAESIVKVGGIDYINLTAFIGTPFSYHIRAVDPDSDLGPLSQWSISIINSSAWTTGGWSGTPVLAATTEANIKETRAVRAGNQGFYFFDVTVRDSAGASDTKHFRVSIGNQPPVVSVKPAAVTVIAGKNDLIANPILIKAIDPEKNYPLTHTLGGTLPAGLALTQVDQTTYKISGTAAWIGTTQNYNLSITFTDSLGASNGADFKIIIANNCADADGDGYGMGVGSGRAAGCRFDGIDCDNVAGTHLVRGSSGDIMLNGADINPGEPDNCTQFDGVDNNCNGTADENADTSNVLTNIDFEAGSVGGFPINWSGGGQTKSTVGITNTVAHSGRQSILMHQDANISYPGTCSQAFCTGSEYPYAGICTWDSVKHQCILSQSDTCHPASPTSVYNEGDAFCWDLTNRVDWAYLSYDVSTLPFAVGDLYIVRFYYKGKLQFENSAMSSFGYSLGWHNQCYPQDVYAYWPCSSNAYGGFNAANPNMCLMHARSAANQTACYESIFLPPLQDGTYNNWTLYAGSFNYTAGMALVKDDNGNKQHNFGLSIGYNNTGPAGNNLYIDDFQLIKCQNR